MRETRKSPSRQTRDTGVRIARQRLIRYRQPDPKLRRWRKWITLGLAVWGLWVLFLSDHSVTRLLHLQAEKSSLEVQAQMVRHELAEAKRNQPSAKLTQEQIERFLREKHIYAREGEIVYVFGSDSTQVTR
jgi:hypothetical protein